mmetsp:Transcript_11566/g.36621  ORF Transcript_11566/g.36621 Transcript_11566/m.36621 type:complete len:206 (+) Transcript_11566:1347-1964(+)
MRSMRTRPPRSRPPCRRRCTRPKSQTTMRNTMSASCANWTRWPPSRRRSTMRRTTRRRRMSANRAAAAACSARSSEAKLALARCPPRLLAAAARRRVRRGSVAVRTTGVQPGRARERSSAQAVKRRHSGRGRRAAPSNLFGAAAAAHRCAGAAGDGSSRQLRAERSATSIRARLCARDGAPYFWRVRCPREPATRTRRLSGVHSV